MLRAPGRGEKGESDLFITDWYGDYPDAENFNYPLFYSGTRARRESAFLADSTLDAMILRARSTTDEAEKVGWIGKLISASSTWRRGSSAGFRWISGRNVPSLPAGGSRRSSTASGGIRCGESMGIEDFRLQIGCARQI
jgi:hypothetical protein